MSGEVILGYDGLEGADAALETATRIAAAFDRPLVVVFGYAPAATGGDTGDLRLAVKDLGQDAIDRAVAAVHAIEPGLQVVVELVDNRPAEAILEAADAYDAMAIVVGGASQGPVRGGLLGAVTYQVVHRARHPVVVVPLPVEAD